MFVMLSQCWKKLLLCTSTLSVAIIGSADVLGKDIIELPDRLDRRLSAAWLGQELGTVLERIAASQNVAVWIDRRVDPQQEIEVRANDALLSEVLNQITAPHQLGWSSLEGVIYIGPRQSAWELATLAKLAEDSLLRVPAEVRERWLAPTPAEWPRLSEPYEILSTWLENAGVRVANPDALSHDLWNEKTLPPLPLVDKTVLLLVGYDLTCEISPSGESCRIVPIARPVLIARDYEAGRRSRALRAAFEGNPAVSISRKGSGIAVTGRWEDQELVMAMLKGGLRENPPQRRSIIRNGQKVFSLRLENQPVGSVIDQLANQLGLTVSWSQELLSRSVDPRTTLVSCHISNGDLHQLLEGIFSPAELRFVLKDNVLEVLPGN
jgi:hypothetical protein